MSIWYWQQMSQCLVSGKVFQIMCWIFFLCLALFTAAAKCRGHDFRYEGNNYVFKEGKTTWHPWYLDEPAVFSYSQSKMSQFVFLVYLENICLSRKWQIWKNPCNVICFCKFWFHVIFYFNLPGHIWRNLCFLFIYLFYFLHDSWAYNLFSCSQHVAVHAALLPGVLSFCQKWRCPSHFKDFKFLSFAFLFLSSKNPLATLKCLYAKQLFPTLSKVCHPL